MVTTRGQWCFSTIHTLLGSADAFSVDDALGLEVYDKFRPTAFLTLDLNFSTLGMDNILADTEAQTHSLLVTLLSFLQLLEVIEYFFLVLFGDAATCIVENHLKGYGFLNELLFICVVEFNITFIGSG